MTIPCSENRRMKRGEIELAHKQKKETDYKLYTLHNNGKSK